MLHRPLAIWVSHPSRVGHHAIVLQGGGVDLVELGLVQVGLEHAFLKVVQHHVLRAAAEVTKGPLVQFGPDLMAGLPDHAAKARSRVAQRGHEQAWFAVPIRTRHQGVGPFTVVHLHLLPGQEGQAVELLRLLVAQLGRKALDRVVLPGKAVLLDQVLEDGHGVALQTQLRFDELAVGFAQGGGHRHRSRWPGWGNLLCRAGGHPGGICLLLQPALAIASDRLAVDAGDAGDLALWGIALEQCLYGGALIGLQDIHSWAFPQGRPELASCQQVPTAPAFTPCPRSVQVGEFEVAIDGGIWVAIRAEHQLGLLGGGGRVDAAQVGSHLFAALP